MVKVIKGLGIGSLGVIALSNLHNTDITPPKTKPYEISHVVSVYDGDTFRVQFKDAHPALDNIGIRVHGIDTPEIRGGDKQAAIHAREYTKTFVMRCDDLYLTDVTQGKYFRLVARVKCGNRDLTQELIENGHGYEYHGGTKRK